MTGPVYDESGVTLWAGDCRDVMAGIADESVDAVVTDPPYDLTAGKKGGTGSASLNLNSPAGRSRISTGNGGFMGKEWDATGVAFDPATWRECLRVLKPGGHLVSFGGTRTSHRMVCAIEDAGFEIRDSVAWMYGQGFSKSRNVSKDIDKSAGAEREIVGQYIHPATGKRHGGFRTDNDRSTYGDFSMCEDTRAVTTPTTDAAKRWAGWGTALKPSHEPICLARKPLTGTVAGNVLEYGTGALNIDATRIAHGDDVDLTMQQRQHADNPLQIGGAKPGSILAMYKPGGRWPANVVLDENQAEALDKQSGTSTSPPVGSVARTKGGNTIGTFAHAGRPPSPNGHGDAGGASRFFYTSKASGGERPSVNGVQHPTVKPLSLIRWLVRLVTPPGGVVLDCFAGSGTTLEAACLEGFNVIGIEQEVDYLPLIVQRIKRAQDTAQDGLFDADTTDLAL